MGRSRVGITWLIAKSQIDTSKKPRPVKMTCIIEIVTTTVAATKIRIGRDASEARRSR